MKQNYLQNRKKYFQSYLPTLLLLLFSWSMSFATECDELQVSNTNTAILVTNITASKSIIKIFDSNWNQQRECNDNCGNEIEFTALNPGEYHVQIQLFDKDWKRLCDTTIDISLEGCICPAVYMPVCGTDGQTYGNRCEAACAGVEIVSDGECAPVTTCDILASILLNPNLCEQCLTEIAVYTYKGKNYLVSLADNKVCADGLTDVIDCETGETLCQEGGIAGFSCGDFFEAAEKLETILEEDCTPCICPEIYAPVCGVDGKTYGNRCEAACAGVEISAEGVCTTVTTCDLLARITLPTNLCDQGLTEIAVYELDGKSYLVYLADNVLLADGQTSVIDCDTGEELCVIGGIIGASCDNFLDKAEKLETIVQETCGDCICPAVYAPVCGANGRTYGNRCEADCAGVDIIAEGACEPCVCDAEYAPVCGVDGQTYSNRCMADCAGVDIITEGECAPVTTCDLLSRITFNTDLCSQCLSEIAVYSYNGKSYLVYIGDHIICADVPNSVVDCDTGEPFCNDGGGELMSTCGDFFSVAEKIEVVLKDDCTPCICTLEYEPVCGADGKTYGNRCEADCAGVDIVAEGECPCICPAVALPVCGVDGKTYINACKAACAGIEVAFDGSCEECIGTPLELACPQGYEPVCGCNEITYSNSCVAMMAGVKSWTEGICPDADDCIGTPLEDVACGQVYEPVCGCDGITYGNSCSATVAGVKSWTESACSNPKDCFGPPKPLIKCDGEYKPVCGCDGKTYQNACTASQNGILSWTEGPCEVDCACPKNYDPVCGVDGRTYGNECEAKCAGVEIASEGECNNDGACDVLALLDFSDDLCEVCITEMAIYSYEGKNYLVQLGDFINCTDAVNSVYSCAFEGGLFCEEGGINTGTPCGDFFEKAIKIQTIIKDDCENDCQGLPTPGAPCQEIYAPVCACNGQTYDNKCVAQNLGLKSWTEGPCEMGCPCPKNYDPVCGVDGKTYGNECEAKCAGVEIASEGECNNDGECDILALILFSDDLCGICVTEIAVYNYEGKNYLVQLGDFINCPDAVNSVYSCDLEGGFFCEEGSDNTGTPCGDFFEKAIKVSTILKDDCENDCQGLPTPGAPCDDIYKPVCACNGQTYPNECTAQSLGLKSWTPGACNFTTIECGDISIAYNKQTIKMSGAPNTSYFFKIHDVNNNYFEVFDCTQNCGNEQTANLPSGTYVVKIYNTEWDLVCEQAITLLEESIPNNDVFRCDDVIVTYKNGTVKLIGDEDKSYHMKVINAHYKDAFACMWECGNTITAKNIPAGRYLVRIFDEDYKELCEESIVMTTSSVIRENNEVQVAAYPNPAQTEFFIHIKKSETKVNGTLQVINAFGQIMTTQSLTNQYDETIKLDVSDYQNGLYFYNVKLPNRQLTSGKFLVNRLY